jgi:hypothetical protein
MSHKTATPFDPDALIEAIAPLLGLPIEPDFQPGIVANLRTIARHAELLDLPLDDRAEPAPVFGA